jgi:CheY-like chemotaxis protein
MQPRPTVLVVDDSTVIRDLIRVNLEFEGYQVAEAVDGSDCLDRVLDVRPDVITLDVVMPKLDGVETARRLRADPRTTRIPIVLVTASAQQADLELGRRVGVDAYVTKPFAPEHLVSVVKSLTDLGSSQQV